MRVNLADLLPVLLGLSLALGEIVMVSGDDLGQVPNECGYGPDLPPKVLNTGTKLSVLRPALSPLLGELGPDVGEAGRRGIHMIPQDAGKAL